MFKKILVALDNSPTDSAMLTPIAELAKIHGSERLLVHVSDGWAARNYHRFQLAESEEMKADRAYLDVVAHDLRSCGIEVETHLAAFAEPALGILKTAEEKRCDLIAMTTHGHRFSRIVIAARLRRFGIGRVPVLLMNSTGPTIDSPPPAES
jgi:nucleotide-binding universal stress UspA family protein